MDMTQTKPKTKQAHSPNIFIATPMYGGMCYVTYALSLARTVDLFLRAGVNSMIDTTQSESLITKARDIFADNFLQSDRSHLMFIDADIGFDPRNILSMVGADKDVICGVYPRTPPFS